MQPMGLREVHDTISPWGFVLFIFIIAGFWCLGCFVASRFGWSNWTALYRCDRQLQGTIYRGRSGRFKDQKSYRGVLCVVLCEDGIGLSLAQIWRPGHPPLLIPWSKVVAAEEKNYIFFHLLRITLSDAGQTFAFELPLSAKPEVARHLAQNEGTTELKP